MVGAVDERGNASQDAFKFPAQCLYLADPYRFAILDIKIVAQASAEVVQEAKSFPDKQRTPLYGESSLPGSPNPSAIHPTAAKTSSSSTGAPPSSYKSPRSVSSNVSQSGKVQRRPRSLEVGARAKEAILDIGRGVSFGIRNLSKSDLTDTGDQSSQLNNGDSEDGLFKRRSRNSSSSHVAQSSSGSENKKEQERSEKLARQVYSLRPQSLTLGAGPLFRPTPTTMNLQVNSRLEASPVSPISESAKIHWERIGHMPAQYVRDEESQAGGISAGVGRAGVFSAFQKEELDSEASDDDSDENGSEAEQEAQTEGIAGLNVLSVLLKVTPPLLYLRRNNLPRPIRETTSITMKIRLHCGASKPISPTHSRISPAGPRTQRSGSDGSRARAQSSIVFVSSSSSSKLLEAVNASRLHADGRKFVGPLSSVDAARLEGIEWVSMEESVASTDETTFEWKWRELGRESTIQCDVLGEKNVKCACAFVELSRELRKVRVLASFNFLVTIPPSRDRDMPLSAMISAEHQVENVSATISDSNISPKPRSGSGLMFSGIQPHMPSVSSTMKPEVIGLGLKVMHAPAVETHSEKPEEREMNDVNGIKLTPRLRRSNGENNLANSPILRNRRISSTSYDGKDRQRPKAVEQAVEPTPMHLDHTEIHLADVEEDGPILRAALQNLERRTASLKRAAKAIIKASADVRANLSQVQASETLLEQNMEQTALLFPSTWGFLSSELLTHTRREMGEFREREKEMLEGQVEAPLRSIVELCRAVQDQSKSFESESKAYYTATQKWLSSRSSAHTNGNGTSSSGRDAVDVYSPAAVGFDKASLKQERVDDKQRLRQARFHLARLEIFRAANEVHGGEAELQLATHLLVLCRWQCSNGARAKEKMKSFDQGVQAQLVQMRKRSDLIRTKCLEVESQIFELQAVLGKGNTDGDIEAHAFASSDVEHTLGAATRHAGFKIKNILSSIGTNKSSSIPTVPSWDSGLEPGESPTKAMTTAAKARSKGQHRATISAQSGPASGGGGINSLAKFQQRLRPQSYAVQETQGEAIEDAMRGQEMLASDMVAAFLPLRLDSIAPVSPMEVDLPANLDNSPSPRRSLSVSGGGVGGGGGGILSTRTGLLDLTNRSPSSPSMNRQMSNGKGRASSDSQRPTLASLGENKPAVKPVQTNAISLLQPRRAAQQSRKKEGILWAMSKPIAGAAGSDAPKSVSRSQNWRECWVVLSGSGHLGEYADWKDVKIMGPSQPLIDLRFAAVREARGVERRFTFEVITRDCRRFFQASNELEMKEWTTAIGMAIESLLNGTSSIRQIDKVARMAGGLSPHGSNGDEFGSQASTHSPQLGQHRAFSQSLTDLSSATSGGPARLFARSGTREEASRKRDSKGSAITTSHLSTLSEGGWQQSTNIIDFPCTPQRSAPWSQHERGISNKTPVSGYVQQQETVYESRPPDFHSSTVDVPEEPDYDRKIEEMVLSSYGGSHHRSSSLLSAGGAPSRQASQGAESLEEGGGGGGGGAPTSTKYSRSREIILLAARPENSYCADCRTQDPRWASWSLNGEPRCIFICITCSGVHRGLGVSVSRVKSVDLDDWTEDQMDSARRWGNDRVNVLYEAKKPKDVKVSLSGDAKERQFWMEKYVKRTWYKEMGEVNEHSRLRSHDFDALESLEDVSDLDEHWDGGLVRKAATAQASRADGGQRGMQGLSSSSSPRWPSSPPVVFVSMLEGEEAGWKSKSNSSLGIGEGAPPGRSSLEDNGPFTSAYSPPLKPSHFSRLPRRSLERRPQPAPASSFSPSLAA